MKIKIGVDNRGISIGTDIGRYRHANAFAANPTKKTSAFAECVFLEPTPGRVGQLLREEAAEIGRHEEVGALERLVLCLIKQGKAAEARDQAQAYFSPYKQDQLVAVAAGIEKRLART